MYPLCPIRWVTLEQVLEQYPQKPEEKSMETKEITSQDLVAERKKAGITQRDLALAMGEMPQRLLRIERAWTILDQAFALRYLATVRRIARERAEAVGAFEIPGSESELIFASFQDWVDAGMPTPKAMRFTGPLSEAERRQIDSVYDPRCQIT